MVAARVAFLDRQHYQPIADAIAARVTAGPVLDIGAGTGYYLAHAVRRLAEFPSAESPQPDSPQPDSSPIGAAIGVALDASRYAAGRSAGADSRIGSVLADAWSRLPVRAGVASTVLSVFAPRDPAEIGRVLAPQGRVVVVTPEPDHLAELRSGFGLLSVDPGKTERLDEAFAGLLQTVERVELRQEMVLSPEDVHALIRMGPSAHHLQPEHLALAVRELAVQTTVTLSVTISVLQRDSSPRSLGDRRH